MSTEFKVVHVWCGHFPDRVAFDAYVEELPREDDDDPLSEFISDQGYSWYDHDLFGARFHDEPSSDIERLLREGQHLMADSFAPAAGDEFRKLALGAVNATFTLYNDVHWKPRSVKRQAYRVDYLGFFPCDDGGETERRLKEMGIL